MSCISNAFLGCVSLSLSRLFLSFSLSLSLSLFLPLSLVYVWLSAHMSMRVHMRIHMGLSSFGTSYKHAIRVLVLIILGVQRSD